MGILGILWKGIAGHLVAAIVIAVIVAAGRGVAVIAVEHTSTVKNNGKGSHTCCSTGSLSSSRSILPVLRGICLQISRGSEVVYH